MKQKNRKRIGIIMTVLGIDTSNKALGVVLGEEQNLISSYYSQASKNHSETLMPAIDFCVRESRLAPTDITKIIVAKGPGSYTGLRIGVTTAKTLSWSLDASLYAISSLACLAKNIQQTTKLIVPFMDARRGFLYTGAYKYDGSKLMNVIEDQYISFEEWTKILLSYGESIVFIGEDFGKLQSLFETFSLEAEIELIIQPSNPAVMLELEYLMEEITDIDVFVPTYLKKVEAEEEWLKKQYGEVETQSYVERLS
ncbi:tRNA (adenosine(37)-N6)-threonylcarbamoyltransferase complex dimerization subunit type 1 TsaB [Melissococcus sp. OM08-11BH]|nr:tRNA (adenosine(37)-N6)-threonylcarbamoyltransferase complex dimerization subunit type 1 TsaB [Melissococcus sp. OM08-11BH]